MNRPGRFRSVTDPVDGGLRVGPSTDHVLRAERAEAAAFGRMIRPCSFAAYRIRLARWRRLRNRVDALRWAWLRMWRLAE